jgi:hypothetical protein
MERFKKRKLGLMALEKRLMLDASITGTAIWFDAADTSTILDAEGDNAASGAAFSGSVATWLDKSGNGNHVTNGTAGERPVYGVNTLNGNGLITFDGVNDRLLNGGVSIPGNDITMFIVFNRTTAAGRDAVFELGGGASRNAFFINNAGGLISYYSNSTFYNLPNAYNAGDYTMVSMTHIGTSLNVWRDAGASITGGTALARAGTTGLYVGDDSSSGDQLQGNIAEIIVYDYILNAEERHYIENYLGAKWGLAITNASPGVVGNTGLNLDQGSGAVINSVALSASDPDNADGLLEYTITNAVDYGTLTNTNTGLTLGLGDTFYQSDLNNGYILYSHDGSANFADFFTFTVNDLYATTAPQDFNFTMNPLNLAPSIQGWTLVSSEDFQTGATGWSNNTTETSNPYFTRFLGRHSLDGGAQNVFKTYALSGTQDHVVLVFDFYEIDSWDGESFRVFIDDALIFNGSFSQAVFNQPADGSNGVVSWQIQELTPFNANFAYGQWTEQIYRFTMTVNTTNAAMKVGFSSTLDQAVTDEAWGVDNINIYEVGNAGVPGPMGIAENSPNGTVVGTVTARDPNPADTLTYSIVGGTGMGVFSIDALTGRITVANSAALDYEATPSYTLTVMVQDNGIPVLSDTETFTINVLDIPENTAPVIPPTGPFTVAENAANNFVVGVVTAADAQNNTITYSITAGNGAGVFAINAATGAIRILSNANLNYEFTPTYNLTITATDNGFGNLASTRVVTINVTNINEAPSFDPVQAVLNSDSTLRYNPATGNFYRFVNTTVNLAAANAAAAAATINGVAGHLATITSAAENTFVRNMNGGFAVWLGGTDGPVEGEWRWTGGTSEAGQMFWLGGAAGSAQGGYYTNWAGSQPDNSGGNEDGIQMQAGGTWNDVNVTTSLRYIIEWDGVAVLASLQNGPYSIAENVAIGTSVGFVHASDPDVPDVITYSITGGTGAALFAINPVTGQITTTAPINYESASSYTLDLRVQDAGGLFDTRTVTINVTDINEAPVLNPAGPFTFPENTAPGTVVTTMVATDQDIGQTLTYSITGGNVGNMFAINSATGAITFVGTPNFENISAYNLVVRVTDNGTGSLFAQRTVAINISNVNEAPVFDPVQQVLANDPTLRYNVVSGNFYRYVNSLATLPAARAAAAAALLDGQPGHLLTISSASENSLIQSMITSAAWIDAEDSVVEGEWRWISGGDAGQMFWLGTGTGSAQGGFYTNWNTNEPNNSGGNEDGAQIRVDGRWNDTNIAGTNTYVIEWEGAAILAARANGPYSIAENSAPGTSVGFARAVDPDLGDTITFSITGGSGAGLFAINATTGQITLTGAVNFEAVNSYTLDLRVQDNNGLFSTTTVTINITDVNEAPVLNPAGPFTFAENIAAGTVITTMTASDQDTGQTLTYSIQGGNTGNMFAINAATGQLRFLGSPNFELQNSYNLVIRVTDNGTGSLFSQQTVNVNITNVNEAPVFDPVEQVLASDPSLRYSAATGNFYRYVATTTNLAAARAAAGAATLDGQSGHLVTITSAAENSFVAGLFTSGSIWLDASDAAVEGEWRWMSGPDAGQLFWLGTAAGSPQNGYYTSWNGGEPNNSGNEDGIQMFASGGWNDINVTGNYAYVIEFEGAAIIAARTNGPYTVVENTPIGTSVGFVSSNDPDIGDTRVYSITGGSGVGTFSINPTTGEIIQIGAVNFEAVNSYTLDLRIQDAGGLFDTVTVTINITDINDVPDQLNLTGNYIEENSSIGTLIGTLSTIDQDPGDTHIYSLVTNPDSKFILVGNELRSNGEIDYERNQTFSIVIRTDDGNGGILDRTFLIQVGDVMDTYVPPPTSPGPTPSVRPDAALDEKIKAPSLLRASLSGGEFGQMDAFYGMGNFHQILRENMTYEVRELMDKDNLDAVQLETSTGFDMPADNAEEKDVEASPQDRFTNLRHALKFFEQISSQDDPEKAQALADQKVEREKIISARQLPESSIDRQFVDVLTYHEQRQARLREALLKSA